MKRLSNVAFLAVLLVASTCVNLVLGWQVRKLRQRAFTTTASTPVTGVKLADIPAKDAYGNAVTIQLQGPPTPTVLYILNPKCGWCARNLENIKTLAHARQKSFRFVGLSLDSPELKKYEETSGIGFPIYAIPSFDAIRKINPGGTPQMLVVSTDGTVTKNWPGALVGDQQKDVEKYFQLALPGLSAATNEVALK